MERFRNLTISTKALVIASGVVSVSIGAYAIYKMATKSDHDDGIPSVKTPPCDRLPSENVDDTDYDERTISSSGKKVLVLGLERSGKSCLLAALSNQEVLKDYEPTLGFNVVCITNVGQRLDIIEGV